MITALCALLLLMQTPSPVENTALEPMQILVGEAPGEGFGETLSLIGDIDEDGFLDFAVGSSGQPGEHGPMAGAVYLYSGTDARLLGILRGKVSFGRFGKAITFGDLTGDGKIELIVGAPYLSSTQQEECGSIHVFSFPECKQIIQISGRNAYERFGHALYCMDINGDGFEDILSGAPGAKGRAGSGCGAVYVYSGNNGKLIKTIEGESPGDWFGYSLTCMDLNQDGFSDLVVSAPGFDCAGAQDSGRVYVYSGQDDRLLYAVDINSLGSEFQTPEGSRRGAADRFGVRIQPLEDLNGDGSLEFMVTSLGGIFADAGVFDGASGRFLYQLASDKASPLQGHPAVCAADYNADQIPDLIRGSIEGSQGLIDLYSGADGSRLIRFPCASGLSAFGNALCEALDTDYSGYPRFVVAGKTSLDPIYGSNGFAHFYQLSPRGVLCRFMGLPSDIGFGSVVEVVDDLNGDQKPELLIGCPFAPGAKGKGVGKVYLYSSTGGKPLQVFEGQAQNSFFGAVVSGAGDIDKDGCSDFIIAAPGFTTKEANKAGRIYLFSSKAGRILPEPLTGNRENDRLGAALAALGDINANGYPDFAVSAPGPTTDSQPGSGRVLIIDGEKLRVFKNFKAPPYESNLGFSLGTVGDLDNDGIMDLLCASMHVNDTDQTTVERVYAFSSKDLKALYFIDAPKRDENFARYLTGIHDIDNDGVPEIMISAPKHAGPAGPDQGCVYICSGRTGEIKTCLVGEEAGDNFGKTIRFIKDVDGDGKKEICISARSDREGRLYILGSSNMLPLGVLDPGEDWTCFGQAFSGGSQEMESRVLLLVGAKQSHADKRDQQGVVIAFQHDLPVKYCVDFPCKLTFMTPEVEQYEEEKGVKKPKGAQALLLNATLPDETLFLFNTRLGEEENKRYLPLQEETALEAETARHFLFFPTRALNAKEVNLWLQIYWKKRTWHLLPAAIGFTFSMQYAEEGKVLTRKLMCRP
ncbi:MAG: FG-GAP-like repeat-containing protein [Planctomycetota bacterium]